jgi:Type I phosphodiesterase / nucleotide pyrophosphatase
VRAVATYTYAAEREPIELLPDLCYAQALVHFGILHETPYRSTALRARPLWAILGSQRLTSGVVGWPVTDPAPPVRGFLITDQFARRVASHQDLDIDELGSPEAAVQRARAIVRGPLGVGAGTLEHPPWQPDAWNREIALQLRDEYRPRLLALRHEGIDRAGHLYLRHAQPRDFGDVSDEERRRFGAVLDRHYAFLDAEIGDLLATLGPEDVLFVVSAFGMEPVGLSKRTLARLMGQPDISGTHEDAPDGFMLAYGSSVRAGRVPLGALVDVTPTILYLLGLPVAREMDGYARTDVFTPAFTASRPITFIPTYER